MTEMIAYCVKCKEKREMENPQAEYTASGTPGTRGKCGVCGTTMFKMGRTPAHENLPKPEPKPKTTKAKSKSKKCAKINFTTTRLNPEIAFLNLSEFIFISLQ